MMYRLLIFFACVCTLVKGRLPRIAGGEPIEIEMPLTNALHGIANKRLQSTCRIKSQSDGGALHDALEIIKHENDHLDKYGVPLNDIAVLRITPPIQMDGKIRETVGLPEQDEVYAGLSGFLTGWGSKVVKGATSEQLLGLTVKVFPLETCDKDYSHFEGIRNGQICAGTWEYKDFCDGDSGGPLVINGRQVGIVSYSGPGCALPNRPGVYIEVDHFRNWIDSHIK